VSKVNKVVSDKIANLLSEKDHIVAELQNVEKKLANLQFVPETFIGTCYMIPGWNGVTTEFVRLTGIEKGIFTYIKVRKSTRFKANREDMTSGIFIGRGTPGDLFYNEDIVPIDSAEFQRAYDEVLISIPR
jgi:hypothetical protein